MATDQTAEDSAVPTKLVALRMRTDGLALIDDWAAKAKTSRSEMIRQLLREAVNARRAKMR